MNIVDLKRMLADRAEDVVPMLLPRGKRQGKEWKVGSLDGDAGESLSVSLRGAKAGVWKDFNEGTSGDLIDLWMHVRGQTLVDALDDIRRHLNVPADPKFSQSKPREYTRPERPKSVQKNPAIVDWFADRGITQETVCAFKVVADGDFILFPFLRDGELVNIKRRSMADKKRQLQEKNAEPCLFGWHLVPDNAREVCITEGEPDAMVLHQMGLVAMSIPNGAGNHQWIEQDWERLERFERINLCYDDDEAGQKGAKEVANRLGIERCRIVTFPGAKDANDYLKAGAGQAEFLQAVAAGKVLDPEELVTVDRYVDDVIQMFDPQGEVSVDPPLVVGREEGWFRFRPGEVTVWTGYNGHGKSMALSLVSLGLMEYGEKFVVFSGELSPKRLIYRAVRQACGMSNPTPRYVRQVTDWLQDKLYVFAIEGSAHSKRMLEVFAYAARRYGVTHCIVDSLMMLDDVPEDGRDALEKQRRFMVELAGFAKRHKVHCHLVAHPRKGDDERGAPGKQDVAGSGKITNMADNVIGVWARLEDENQPKRVPEEGEEDVGEKFNAKVEVFKQRNGDTQHKSVIGWYDADSYQICRTPDRKPRRFPSEVE